MSFPLEEIKQLISEISWVPGLEGVVLSTVDGLPVYSTLSDKEQEEKISALSAVLSEVGTRTSLELGKGDPDWISVQAKDGSGMIVVKVGEAGHILVLYGKEAKLGVLLYYLRSLREKLVKAMS